MIELTDEQREALVSEERACNVNRPECTSVNTLGERAVEAFKRDLPRLLSERAGEWVAYHGEQQLGFARTSTELYQACFQKRLPSEEFIVCCIEPDADVQIMGLGMCIIEDVPADRTGEV